MVGKRSQLISAIILLTSFAIIFGLGYLLGHETYEPRILFMERQVPYPILTLPESYYKEEYPSPIDVIDALEILREARFIHQDVVDRPQYANKIRGDVQFHQKWVTRYDQLRELVITLSSLNQ
jgi:hypothetical protein